MIPVGLAKPLAYALAVLALLLLGRTYGQREVYEEWMAANEAARIAAVKIIVKSNTVTVKRVTEYKDRVVYVEREAKEIQNEVVVYREVEKASPVVLPPEWVRIHDRAAAGPIPRPAPGDDGTRAAASSGEALEAVTGNYTEHHRVAARLAFCQAWVREQYETINGVSLGY